MGTRRVENENQEKQFVKWSWVNGVKKNTKRSRDYSFVCVCVCVFFPQSASSGSLVGGAGGGGGGNVGAGSYGRSPPLGTAAQEMERLQERFDKAQVGFLRRFFCLSSFFLSGLT